jgi:hypothetical protein
MATRDKSSVLIASDLGHHALVLDEDDIVHLLRAAVEREGGQTAFAKHHGVHRSTINRVLKGKLPVGDAIAKVLRLRRVYIAE